MCAFILSEARRPYRPHRVPPEDLATDDPGRSGSLSGTVLSGRRPLAISQTDTERNLFPPSRARSAALRCSFGSSIDADPPSSGS